MRPSQSSDPTGQHTQQNPPSLPVGQARATLAAGRPLLADPNPPGGNPRPLGQGLRPPSLQISQQAYLQAASAQLQNFNGTHPTTVPRPVLPFRQMAMRGLVLWVGHWSDFCFSAGSWWNYC